MRGAAVGTGRTRGAVLVAGLTASVLAVACGHHEQAAGDSGAPPDSGGISSDGGGEGGGETTGPPSCRPGGPGLSDCGPDRGSCCESPLVPGGTFFRSYDGVSPGFTTRDHPATVSAFRLDRYEITVGRFEQFIAAVRDDGWVPAAGSGKHAHLAGGAGLNAGTEPGWDASWTSILTGSMPDWAGRVTCGAPYDWVATDPPDAHLPMTCLTWFEVYAFCIWDGGFLPSEAEWNFAAAGGDEQRVFPWSTPATSTTIDYSYASYDCRGDLNCPGLLPVGSLPKGNGKWGQSDLAGNLSELTLDRYAPYALPCDDCAELAADSFREPRGGDYELAAPGILTSFRYTASPTQPLDNVRYVVGARCARAP